MKVPQFVKIEGQIRPLLAVWYYKRKSPKGTPITIICLAAAMDQISTRHMRSVRIQGQV